MGYDERRDNRDDPDNLIDAAARGLARLRDFMTQIADPTAPPRPKPVTGPGRRPPREAPRPLAANVSGAREPLVDVFDEGDLIRVVADMPGAEPETLRLAGAGNRLTLAAAGPARRYERTVLLPAPVRTEGAAPSWVNGIMEVFLPAERPAPPPSPPSPPPATPEVVATATATTAPVEEQAGAILPVGVDGEAGPAAGDEPDEQREAREEREDGEDQSDGDDRDRTGHG